MTSLRADLARRGLIGLDSHPFPYNSSNTTAVATPVNNEAPATEVSVRTQHSTAFPCLEQGKINSNIPVAAIHRGNYKAPTVEDLAENQPSPTFSRSALDMLNPEAAPFVFTHTSTSPNTPSLNENIRK